MSQPGVSQRKVVEPPGSLCYKGMSRWWSGHSHLGEVLLLGTSESQSDLTSRFSFCSGWLAALSTVNKGPLAVTIIMMVVAGFFTLCAGLSLFLLQRVSRADPTVSTGETSISPGHASKYSLLPKHLGSNPSKALGEQPGRVDLSGATIP